MIKLDFIRILYTVLNITYEHYEIVSVRDLKDELCGDCYYTPKEYCDFRFGTNLRRFHFDPYTGNKINWKEVKKLLEERENV